VLNDMTYLKKHIVLRCSICHATSDNRYHWLYVSRTTS